MIDFIKFENEDELVRRALSGPPKRPREFQVAGTIVD
jgi:hypothetical protein